MNLQYLAAIPYFMGVGQLMNMSLPRVWVCVTSSCNNMSLVLVWVYVDLCIYVFEWTYAYAYIFM